MIPIAMFRKIFSPVKIRSWQRSASYPLKSYIMGSLMLNSWKSRTCCRSIYFARFSHCVDENSLKLKTPLFSWEISTASPPVRHSSSKSSPGIFTPADKGTEVPFLLKPDLNLEVLFDAHLSQLEASLQARRLDVDLSNMISLWKDVKALEKKKEAIELARMKNREKAKELSKLKVPLDSAEVKSHREEGKQLREDLKEITSAINSYHDRLYPLALALPNWIHSDVPLGSKNKVIEEHQSTRDAEVYRVSHSGCKEKLISVDHSLVHPGSSYLVGDAASLEQTLLEAGDEFLTKRGFTQMSCPDMVKPFTLDALGQGYRDLNEAYVIETRENEMNLTGLSPLSFYAYYMMSVLETRDLPERCFAIGRSYNASLESADFEGLHQHNQSSQVQYFCLFENSLQEESALFSQFFDHLVDFYTQLGIPFRVVDSASENLLPSVYRRRAVEVWLASINEYREVAFLCSCSDFVSRRLMIKYPKDPKKKAVESRERNFAYSLHGTVLNCNVLMDHLIHR